MAVGEAVAEEEAWEVEEEVAAAEVVDLEEVEVVSVAEEAVLLGEEN